ncbi:hypothetical protein [Halobacteriovorax sp. HLS]|uniref:hypothetical protein n=1 Tax=Halobacteriovorax sp. HLS TaxID=2234000 RepID=UPI000FDA1CA0|nr:hypothetical protein [Halobacteriovorax sp. HLS]
METKLKSFLSAFSSLMDYENHSVWSHWMNNVSDLLDSDLPSAYDRYTQAYGGAGTLNDIHFSDPWSLTLFWRLRSILTIYFQCAEMNKEVTTQLGEFENSRPEDLKVHCCSSCGARFVTQRDLILTEIPNKINTLILEEIHSTPMKMLWERFSLARKESVTLLDQLSKTIDKDWFIVKSDPYFRPCESCQQNTLKLQHFKYDGQSWSMLS